MVILRNVQNDQFYKHVEGDTYLNLITGVEGNVDPEIARKVFRINVEMTALCHQFPNIELLVKSIKLKFDNKN